MDDNSCDMVLHDLKKLIEIITYHDHDGISDLKDWLELFLDDIDINCWELIGCGNNECKESIGLGGRCWLTAGTAGGKVGQCSMAKKYKTCIRCTDVFQKHVNQDKMTAFKEYIYILVYNLLAKQEDLLSKLDNNLQTELNELKNMIQRMK